MSLDISLTTKDEEEIMDMNWFRNPYGLCNWAEDNLEYLELQPGSESSTLYYVCNHWAYDKSKDVDRKLFKGVVDYYWEHIKDMDRAYYFFDLSSYRQFVEPSLHLIPKVKNILGQLDIMDIVYMREQRGRIGIDVEYFKPKEFNLSRHNTTSMLKDSKKWFKQLVEFAEELQDEATIFYCSN